MGKDDLNQSSMINEQDIKEFITALNRNTNQMIKLKKEVRKQREVEEENVNFLQELIKMLLTNQNETKKKALDFLSNIFNWGIKIAVLLLLGYLGIQQYLS